MAKSKGDGLVWGVILVALGIIFFIQEWFHVQLFQWIWQFWPLILIVWGLVIIKNSRS